MESPLIRLNKFAVTRKRRASDATGFLPDRYEPMAVSPRSGASAAGYVRIAEVLIWTGIDL